MSSGCKSMEIYQMETNGGIGAEDCHPGYTKDKEGNFKTETSLQIVPNWFDYPPATFALTARGGMKANPFQSLPIRNLWHCSNCQEKCGFLIFPFPLSPSLTLIEA